MDPVTSASKRFLAEAEAFFLAHPGAALPLFAEPAARSELVKVLRLAELSPENRRPLFVYEEPFLDRESYFDGLTAAILEDYAALCEGAAKEGIELPAFYSPGHRVREPFLGLGRAACTVERVAVLLSPLFEGLLLALVPCRVEDGPGFRRAMMALAQLRFSSGARLAVFDPPGGPLNGALGSRGAHFEVDPGPLRAYLRGLGAAASKGPPGPPSPRAAEEQRQDLGDAAAPTLPAPGTTAKLRALLLAAAAQSEDGQLEAAEQSYREARALCRSQGLPIEEAVVLLALGGIQLAAGTLERSVASYREAARVAQHHQFWAVACQAWLGVGGACLAAGCQRPAADAYHEAAQAAERGKLDTLHGEATRLCAKYRQTDASA
jgi:hypothetical protein